MNFYHAAFSMTEPQSKNFVNSLTTAQLKIFVAAFAQGKSFEQAQRIVADAERDESTLPEYLAHVLRLLRSPRTGAEIARALRVDKKSIMTYIAKLRRRGLKIATEGKYGKTRYRIIEDAI